MLTPRIGREISAEVAARTDELNEFPADMWKKLGDAGYAFFFWKFYSKINSADH
jgi:hypothetical protein